MNRTIAIAGAVFAATAVVLGAFGAHALKDLLAPAQQATFETGVRYHFYHAFALLFTALLSALRPHPNAWTRIAWLFGLGIVLFSGSVYLLATAPVTHLHWAFLGPITPLGGTLLIGGWVGMAVVLSKK